MTKLDFDSMGDDTVCKLVFDDDEEDEYHNENSSPNASIPSSPIKQSVPRVNLPIDPMPGCSYSLSRHTLRPSRLFSPRKSSQRDIQTSSDTFVSSSPNRPSTSSFRGYVESPTPGLSPPDNKVKNLKLSDSPNTPKTLLQKSQNPHGPAPSGSTGSKMSSVVRPAIRSRLFGSGKSRTSLSESTQENKVEVSKEEFLDKRANINPFTPTSSIMSAKKRTRKSKKNKDDSSGSIERTFVPLNSTSPRKTAGEEEAMDCSGSPGSGDSEVPASCGNSNLNSPLSDILMMDSTVNGEGGFSDDEEDIPSKRIAIHDVNVSRYNKEFLEIAVIGKGVYGTVFLCRHRLDGCLYAIKRSLKPVAGSNNERIALNEVYAHAVLGAHPHVVRYFSAWAENDHMIIQNEYCNGGSLATRIEMNRQKGKLYTEDQLKIILLHVAKGLRFIHSLNMVHLDVKPDNIFVCSETRRLVHAEDSADDGFEEDNCLDDLHVEFTYKIGDLGHVTSVLDPKVEEGDCRYLPREILQEDYAVLHKADIFALGLTLYEAATNVKLPLNGDQWQELRNGHISGLDNFSPCFQNLLKLMIHNDPKKRPSAIQLLNHEIFTFTRIGSSGMKSRVQLRRELEVEKLKNERLEEELRLAKYVIQALSPSTQNVLTSSSTATPANSNLLPAEDNNNYVSPPIVYLNNKLEDANSSFCINSNTPPTGEKTSPNILTVNNSQPPFSVTSNIAVSLKTTSDDLKQFSVMECSDAASPNSTPVVVQSSFMAASIQSMNFTLGSSDNSISTRQCPYNTRSQQHGNGGKKTAALVSHSSRTVGKRTGRSYSHI